MRFVCCLGAKENHVLYAGGLGNLPVNAGDVVHFGISKVDVEIPYLAKEIVLARSISRGIFRLRLPTYLINEPLASTAIVAGVFVH